MPTVRLFLVPQLFDVGFVTFGLVDFAHFATDFCQFLVCDRQYFRVGGGIFLFGKTSSEIINDRLNFGVLADQRDTAFVRSAKDQATKVLPVAKHLQAFGLHNDCL